MSLVGLWSRSRSQLESKHVQQIIGIAGTGKLLDGEDASKEFREFLSSVPSSLLSRYATECLAGKFDANGLALQDIVNQIGRRLGFHVEDGRYRGSSAQIGHDGLWRSSFGNEIIVEVKTTDAYRVSLDSVAAYRKRLVQEKQVQESKSSILIVVGRQDTGDLEAQIRGSRHAWDVRLVSVDALVRLMLLKETVEDPRMLKKVADVLVPQEFTKIDGIIDLVFSAAEEVRHDAEETELGEELASGKIKRAPQFIPSDFHAACITRIEKSLNRPLVKQTRATYSSPDKSLVVVCAVSRAHTRGMYWYAFHPHQKEKLEDAKDGYVHMGAVQTKLFSLFHSRTSPSGLKECGSRSWRTDSIGMSVFGKKTANFFSEEKKGFSEIHLTKYLIK
ncbi:MAG: hypothetical protein P0111_11780 [Nitrospira sp.]|nr:hypothetical protein [Nitrospira sp.]